MTQTARSPRIVRGRLWSRAVLIGALGGLAFAGFYIVSRIEWGVVWGPIIGDSGILEKSAINRRGDTATALTDATESTGPDRLDIRLRPVDDWLWTPLVNSESYGVHVNLKWRNDDMLEIDLAFGCFVQMTHLLHRIGPIHVTYHFTYNDPTLDLDLARSAPVTTCSAHHYIPEADQRQLCATARGVP